MDGLYIFTNQNPNLMDVERYFLLKILERYFIPKYLGDPNLVDQVSDLIHSVLSSNYYIMRAFQGERGEGIH